LPEVYTEGEGEEEEVVGAGVGGFVGTEGNLRSDFEDSGEEGKEGKEGGKRKKKKEE